MNNLDTNVIICGDTIETMKSLPDECIDLIFADPPYWMRIDGILNRANGNEYDGCDDEWDNQFTSLKDYQDFTREWLSECRRILKKNGSIWVIGGMQCIYTIGSIMQELGFWFVNDVVWAKKNPTPNFMGTRLNNSHETLIWAIKDQKYSYTFNYKTAKELNTDTVNEKDFSKGTRKQMGSVWRIGVCQGTERIKDKEGNKLHSTQKPEELLYRVLAINSKVGDIVLDPFGGTMTTGAVAKRMGRRYICIERDEEYCKYGKLRLDQINPSIGDIEKATFDIKPPKVTFEEMIKAGYFHEGENMYYNGKPYFNLTNKGKLVKDGENEVDIHSSIATIKGTKAKRLNGWDYWQVKRDNEFILIDVIRKQYLREVKNYE